MPTTTFSDRVRGVLTVVLAVLFAAALEVCFAVLPSSELTR